MSTVPINVTKSAKYRFLLRYFNNIKWLKEGDFILQRNGQFVLSEINETPNSPFGDSTDWYAILDFNKKPSLQNLKCFIISSILVYSLLVYERISWLGSGKIFLYNNKF